MEETLIGASTAADPFGSWSEGPVLAFMGMQKKEKSHTNDVTWLGQYLVSYKSKKQFISARRQPLSDMFRLQGRSHVNCVFLLFFFFYG